jgi:molecular chaperone GrpE
MSGEPSDGPTQDTSGEGETIEDPGNATGPIPVEVVPPEPTTPTPEPDRAVGLENKIALLEKEKKDNWDRYLRAAADLENHRRRTRKELDEARVDARGKVLKEMLPVVDNLERAIEHAAPTDQTAQPIIEGIQLVLRQFMTAFERLEVTVVEAMNQPFDPNLHEAISQQESDQPAGTVVQVLQRGYRVGDKLLRPALVVVAKAKAS